MYGNSMLGNKQGMLFLFTNVTMDSSQETRKENENIKSLVLTEVADKKKKKKKENRPFLYRLSTSFTIYMYVYIDD